MKLIAQIEAFKARRPISQNPSSSASGEVSRIPSANSACTRRNSFGGNLAGTWRGCQGSQEPSAIPSHKCEKSPWKIVHNLRSHREDQQKKCLIDCRQSPMARLTCLPRMRILVAAHLPLIGYFQCRNWFCECPVAPQPEQAQLVLKNDKKKPFRCHNKMSPF